MATRKAKRARFTADSETAKAVGDSAHKIWLAGLGAFERAKVEGPKMFEVLVEQGKEFAGRARGAADQALQGVRDGAGASGGRFDKLEKMFEERVSKSLGRLGVMTRAEVADLSRQVAELTEEVRSMIAAGPGVRSRAKAPRRGAAKPRGVKRKAKRAAPSAKGG
jgi:poly(hydroxyalkanoate) granule-associated protein